MDSITTTRVRVHLLHDHEDSTGSMMNFYRVVFKVCVKAFVHYTKEWNLSLPS